jgi:DNA polymerase III epsilon subunit-like protein
MNGSGNRRMSEIVFFDVETTAPSPAGRWWLLEFGAILVCPRKLVEVASYETLIRPGDLSAVSRRFTDVEAIASAPTFREVADKIFDILDGTYASFLLPPPSIDTSTHELRLLASFPLTHETCCRTHTGRVWAGHNIQRFDCPRLREAFADIGRPAPEPAGVIDSLNVLAAEFGRRAGDLKMATLATYFGIGTQKHRSLDDARMNLEVLKHCATVLLLESSLPQAMQLAGRDGAVTRRSSTASAHHRPAAMSQTKLPFAPAVKAVPAPAAGTAQKSGGKRDSLGKPVGRANATSNKPAPEAAAPAALSARPPRRPTAATPFHMILRHSRAILR